MRFTAEIKKHPNLDGAYIEMPFDVVEEFGAKRVKVKATFDDMPYRGSIVTMGGRALIGVTKEIRKRIGKSPGDTVEVTLVKDDEERIVTLPSDVICALETARVLDAWSRLSYSKQRDRAMSIEAAKKPQTRTRRIEKLVEELLG